MVIRTRFENKVAANKELPAGIVGWRSKESELLPSCCNAFDVDRLTTAGRLTKKQNFGNTQWWAEGNRKRKIAKKQVGYFWRKMIGQRSPWNWIQMNFTFASAMLICSFHTVRDEKANTVLSKIASNCVFIMYFSYPIQKRETPQINRGGVRSLITYRILKPSES